MKIIISILILISIIIFILCLFYSYKHCKLDLYDKDIFNYKKNIIDNSFKDSLVVKNLCNVPIYIINLKQSTNRRDYIQDQLTKYNIKNYKFISAINGNKYLADRKPLPYTKISNSFLKTYKIGDTYFKIREPDYASNSEVGCTLSHLKAIETAYNDNHEKVIIVEDDINLLPIKTWGKTLDEFLETAPKDWEAIYDGWVKDKHYNKNIEFIKYSISQPFGAWFYIINRKGMKSVLNKFKQDKYYILDAYSNNLKRGGLSGITADIYIPWLINAYSCKTDLVMPLNNNLNSTIHNSHTKAHKNMAMGIINRIYKNNKNINNKWEKKQKLSISAKFGLILGAILLVVLLIVLLCKCKSEKYGKTIFVSIASYRDSQCKNTIKELFTKAKHPRNIILGICDQSIEKDEACGIIDKYKDQIRTLKLHPNEAHGPLFARALIMPLYHNEDYFLQIDSHTLCDKDWDVNLIAQIEELKLKGFKKPIIASYPKDTKDRHNNFNFQLCKTINIGDYPLQFDSVAKVRGDVFKKQMFFAGGFSFTIGDFVRDVRFPASLAGIFNGEEILLSYYAYCQGYDIFSQKKNCLYHNYSQEGRKIFSVDKPKTHSKTEAKSKKKLLDLLFKIEPKCADGRVAKDFWKKIGWDFKKKKIDPKVEKYWCNDSPEY